MQKKEKQSIKQSLIKRRKALAIKEEKRIKEQAYIKEEPKLSS